jgi:Flp pilus assembly protein TadD
MTGRFGWTRARGVGLAGAGLVALAIIGVSVGPACASPTSNALVRQGQQALAHKNYDAARRSFEQAIVADPHDAGAFGDLGRANQRLGAVDKAWRYYRTALEIEPDNVRVLAWSGDLDVSLGRLDSAREKLDHLRAVCGECADYRRLDHAITASAARQAHSTGNRP